MQKENDVPIYAASPTEFLKEGRSFIPKIASSFYEEDPLSNLSMITLDGGQSSLLRWQSAINEATKIQKGIVWEMEFDQFKNFSRLSPMSIATIQRAAYEFSENVYPQFRDKSFGVILGRFFEDDFQDIDHFSKIMHTVGAFFPEELLVFALVDVSFISAPSRLATCFSKERFPHIHFGFKGASIPLFGLNWEKGKTYGGSLDTTLAFTNEAKIGLCLPSEAGIKHIEGLFDAVCHKLEEKKINYRIFDEALFTEYWHGLDKIVIFKDGMDSATFARKCKGFTITGGEIIEAEEIIRDRGI